MDDQSLRDTGPRLDPAPQKELPRRLEALDGLLHTLADVLDIREVFGRISQIAGQVLPHDMLSILVFTEDKARLVVHAIAGGNQTFPETVPLPEQLKGLAASPWDYRIYPDVLSDPSTRDIPPAQAGYRSALSVSIRVRGDTLGAVDFWSFEPHRYQTDDVLIARRIADHVAVALSHQRLAEEAQRTAEARALARTLESRVKALTEELDARTGYRRVVGDSAEWRAVLKQATQVAANETTVLVLGESGTGKEVVARLVHRASPRASGPFVALNCAALPEQLLEAELFGYERGAFTGAVQTKPGQLEQAAGGTLFLDEVGEMSLPAQAKFLRVLQEREFQRLGGTRVLRSDARIIAATNRDLERAIALNQFREDLYYRLNVFAIFLPPLRDRRADILALSDAFLAEIGRSIARPAAGISRDARERLLDYHWPGNVRELRNILERASILCDGGLIAPEHLAIGPGALPVARSRITVHSDAAGSSQQVSKPAPVSSAGDLKSMERDMIAQALQRVRFNKSRAAKDLGLTRQQLYLRMKKYGLE
jgi:transcriptional regulator with GAF, ATPase, and Fis domain